MNSIWTQTQELPKFGKLEGDRKTEVLIIGGGITGILCAYWLQKANVDYVLVEANRICSGITKNTTAKITSQHGLIYAKLVREFGYEKARLYLEANEEALKKYQQLCKIIDCDFQEKDSYVYSLKEEENLEAELRALERIGYPAEYVKELSLPFDTVGAVKFTNQAQMHPLKLMDSFAKELNIYEQTKVIELGPHTAITAQGTITAKHIIIATHFPMNNKHGAYFLKLYQSRSYVLALEGAKEVKGMYVDASNKGLSFRDDKEYLLLGGGGHRTGKGGGNWQELRKFAKEYYPYAKEYCSWATQDCMSLDGIPYIGRYGKNTEGLWVATGYNKWGMTSSMVAALLLRDLILEKENQFEQIFSPRRSVLRKQLWINMGEATRNLLSISSKRCPHLGCALKWNDEENTWDCPCHGSRFTREGELIDNPAADDLQH